MSKMCKKKEKKNVIPGDRDGSRIGLTRYSKLVNTLHTFPLSRASSSILENIRPVIPATKTEFDNICVFHFNFSMRMRLWPLI